MELLKEFWFLAVAVFSGVVWVVRIESKAAANTKAIETNAAAHAKEIERLDKQRHEDRQEARDSRDAQNEILKEMRSDIKALLRGQRE